MGIQMRFPVPVQELEKRVPHRPPMVWVDEVVAVTPTHGECSVKLNKTALYMSSEGLRQSSMIEWLAQSFAYVRATQHLCGLLPPVAKPNRVFLVGVRDAKYSVPFSQLKLTEDSVFRIRVGNIRERPLFSFLTGLCCQRKGSRCLRLGLRFIQPDGRSCSSVLKFESGP